MVSKNLTEDGQRKKWYASRKETLEYKSFELVDLCQAEVALFIRPYGEDNMFIFKSRPDFPEADSVSTIEFKTPDDYVPKSKHLKAVRRMRDLAKVDAGNEIWAHNPLSRTPAQPKPSHIDPRLRRQSQIHNDTGSDTVPRARTSLSTETNPRPYEATPEPVSGVPERPDAPPSEQPRSAKEARRPVALDLQPNTLQSNIYGPALGVSPPLFVSPPVTPPRRPGRGGIGRRRGERKTTGMLKPRF